MKKDMSKSLIGLILVVIGFITWIVGFVLNLDILNPEDTMLCMSILVIGGIFCGLGGLIIGMDEKVK